MSSQPLIELKQAEMKRGQQTLWRDLNLSVKPGEFVAILGPNGAGKTTLLKILMGLLPLTKGEAAINGQPPKRGNHQIGYVPQQKAFDPMLPLRGRDLVELGLNGYRYGLSSPRRAGKLVDETIKAVGASKYADSPIGLLSGGQQQRLRVAQALVGKPEILFCDEPLLSLDLASQSKLTSLLNKYRQENNAAVMFVTHEINPILPYVDKVLYLANGKWLIDTPDKVLEARRLSQLYGTPIEVLKVHGRVLVVGAEDSALTPAGAHHAHEGDIGDEH